MNNFIEIDKNNIAPYLSILLGSKSNKSEPCKIHEEIIKLISEDYQENISIGKTTVNPISEIGVVKITPYSIIKDPSWSKDLELKDIENHVFISFSVRDNFAFYFSEKGKKDTIRDQFGKNSLSNLFPIPMSKLNGNFINEDEIKMLWLSGINGRDNFKADSKVLGGKSVADTLDPLIDQSYMMSAVRTELWGKNKKSSVGINPFKSSIWRGPCKDWTTFENRVIEILDILTTNTNESETPIGILSYPISHVKDLKTPYDFSLVDYDFLPEEEGQHRKELLKKLQYEYRAELVTTLIDSDIALNIYHEDKHIGYISLEVEVDDYKVNIKIKSESPIKKNLYETYKKVFKHPELIKCWFESGHAIVNGMVFRTGYQDVDYNKFLWADYEDYNIKKEKPGIDPKKPELNNIGNEKSLFCWVKNRWNGCWITADEFNTTEKPQGWLYCDDGAGEKADFIHYVEYKNIQIISLIHVKAAKGDSPERKMSVGAHDVVLNQAVKNLRYSTRKTLIEDLKTRHKSANFKGCWFNGKPANAEDFFRTIESLKENKNIKNRVIVVQPHTQKSKYMSSKGNKIRTQLDVLLVSAENSIRSSGAEFHIIGLNDNRHL